MQVQRSRVLYDRSRVLVDWACPRRRYYAYEHGGRGLVPNHGPLPLQFGTIVHEALATLARTDPDPAPWAAAAAQTLRDWLATTGGADTPEAQQRQQEHVTLVEGLLLGFARFVWPVLRMAYPRVIAVEQDLCWEQADDLAFMAKPDLILADADDRWWYVEYKTTSYKGESWIAQWETAIQLHATARAIEVVLDHPVEGVIVQGLYKGSARYGRQQNVCCYGYRKPGRPPLIPEQLSYAYRPGWTLTPVWELPGGITQWIANMPATVGSELFPQSAPIGLNRPMVEAFFRQRALREPEIAWGRALLVEAASDETHQQQILDAFFPQAFDQCQTPWGTCAYQPFCYGTAPAPGDCPPGFAWRVPHHEAEEEDR